MWALICSSLLIQVLSAFAAHGIGPAEVLGMTSMFPHTDGMEAGVTAGAWSPADPSSLSHLHVWVCTRSYSPNKSVPVWEISVKSVFCKSWLGSCFHVTNPKQLAAFFGGLCFSKSVCNFVLSFVKAAGVGRTQSRYVFTRNLLVEVNFSQQAGHGVTAWTT